MTVAVLCGTAAVLGDFVSGDVILPGRYAFLPAAEAVGHVLGEIEGANARVRAHPILIAGEAFGYGSGREASARALKAAGVQAVVGGPFARMFFRNAINNGVLVIDCPALVAARIVEGTMVEVDLDGACIRAGGRTFPIPPIPPMIRDIVAAGSIVEYGRARLAAAAGAAS